MFEWSTLHLNYPGRNFYTNADPAIGSDTNPGTQEQPFNTIAKALSECRDGEGDKVWAYSSRLHLPAFGFYAFTENVSLNKNFTAILGRWSTTVTSGIGIDLLDVTESLISGAFSYGNGMDIGFRLKNTNRCILVRSAWVVIDPDPGQIGFELTADALDPNLEFYGGNGFIFCFASGGNVGGGVDKTTGFKLTDYGLDSNYLLDCSILKTEVGIEIANSSTHGEHAITSCRFQDNDTPIIQADNLHHWFLFGNSYDDIDKGSDGWGKQLPWPNEEATWTFLNPDPAPITNVAAFFANKMGTIASTTTIKNLLLRNILLTGSGKAP